MSEKFLKTAYDDDPLMLGAFIGCVSWAFGEDKIMNQYREDTGDQFRLAENHFDKMIDRATGADLAFIQRFADWVEKEIFGTPDQVYGEGDPA